MNYVSTMRKCMRCNLFPQAILQSALSSVRSLHCQLCNCSAAEPHRCHRLTWSKLLAQAVVSQDVAVHRGLKQQTRPAAAGVAKP